MTTMNEETSVRFSPYSQMSIDENSIVSIDHNYAKPWSTHPDASNAQPVHRLFMEHWQPNNSQQVKEEDDSELIDVEADEDKKVLMYDESPARLMMMEGEKLGAILASDPSEGKDDWEDHITSLRNTWTVPQNRIFAKIMRILQADRLARLAIHETKNEPIQRRLQIDKAAKRVRQAFSNVSWDMKLLHWLHNMFLENLRGQLLISYLEVLQTLKTKVPSLTEKLLAGTTSRSDILPSESFSNFFKKTWDPVVANINQQKLKKLPENPILLILPSAPMLTSNPLASKRHRFWQSQLSSMGKVMTVALPSTSTKITLTSLVEGMVHSARSKILEVKTLHPGRPIVLIGWEVGATVACQVAQMELVQAIVCLGYPTSSISGHRWDIDDHIYACKTPTLFVVGQHASTNSLDMLEEIREKIRIETGLVVVGGADSQLRMCRAKKKSSNVTQAVVDRCILEEMFDFLGRILSQRNVRLVDPLEEMDLKKSRKRKQKDFVVSEDGQTSVKKQSGLKLPKGLTISGAPAALYNARPSSGSGKIGKKPGAKKKMNKLSNPSKKQVLHLNLTVPVKTVGEQPALSANNKAASTEAAAIASAPELSNLLQNIKPSQPVTESMTNKSAPTASTSTSPPTTSVATTTALTLSRFLASSGLLKNAVSFKPEDDLGLTLGIGEPESDSVSPSSKESPVKQQPQILIRANSSSEAFSLPYFSVGGKSSKPSLSSGKVVSSGSGSGIISSIGTSQIHQLLLASSTSLLTGNTVPVTTQARSLPSLLLTPSPGQLRSPSPSNLSPSLAFFPASPSKAPTSVGDPMLHSPGASVINIGSDTVFMKETPPTSSPAPGTVSIDLGQIASSNSGSILKLSPAPKVSLIPLIKPLPTITSVLPSSDSVTTQSNSPSSPSLASKLSASLKSSSPSPSLPQQPPALPAPAPRTIQMTTASKGVSQLTGPNSEASLGSSSQKRHSTLPSNLITLQLSPSKDSPAPSTIITLAKADGPVTTVDESKPTLVKPQLKSTTAAPLTLTTASKVQSASSVLSALKSCTEKGEPKPAPTLSKFSTADLASLMMSSGGQAGSSGQFVFQCRNPLVSSAPSSSSTSTPSSSSSTSSSSSLSSSVASSVLSKKSVVSKAELPTVPQVVMGSSSEPLGKVTSLLESSPVITGKSSSAFSPSGTKSTVTTAEPMKKSTTTTLCSPSISSLGSSSPVVSSSGQKTSTTAPPSPSTPTASPSSQGSSKASKATISSYTATPKPVLPTIASTRTRRIKTPKQYDL